MFASSITNVSQITQTTFSAKIELHVRVRVSHFGKKTTQLKFTSTTGLSKKQQQKKQNKTT